MRRRDFLASLASAAGGAAQPATRWKAGVAAREITPAPGIWMAGFAARTCPSLAVALPLQAKALAVEDEHARRAVLVTLDLLGVTADTTTRVAEAVRLRHGLSRESLCFNASHTHSGPVTADLLSVAYELSAEQQAVIRGYTTWLE